MVQGGYFAPCCFLVILENLHHLALAGLLVVVCKWHVIWNFGSSTLSFHQSNAHTCIYWKRCSSEQRPYASLCLLQQSKLLARKRVVLLFGLDTLCHPDSWLLNQTLKLLAQTLPRTRLPHTQIPHEVVWYSYNILILPLGLLPTSW